jgi:hypothetical protein
MHSEIRNASSTGCIQSQRSTRFFERLQSSSDDQPEGSVTGAHWTKSETGRATHPFFSVSLRIFSSTAMMASCGNHAVRVGQPQGPPMFDAFGPVVVERAILVSVQDLCEVQSGKHAAPS